MADNIDVTPGTGKTIAADEVGGFLHQRVKASIGADGSAADLAFGQAAMAASLPVTLASNQSDIKISLDGELVGLASGTYIIGSVVLVSGSSYIGSVTAVGNVANDGVDAGNPVKIGGRAITALDGQTLVGSGDRADIMTDLDGVLLIRESCPQGSTLLERVFAVTGTAAEFSVFGVTAGQRNVITHVSIINNSSVNGYVDFRDGLTGTIIHSIAAPANGGAVSPFTKELRQPTAAKALAYQPSSAGMGALIISLIGYKSKL